MKRQTWMAKPKHIDKISSCGSSSPTPSTLSLYYHCFKFTLLGTLLSTGIMKFCRSLMMLLTLIAETLPDWQDKFLSYKVLKKQLNLIYPKEDDHVNTIEPQKLDETDDFEELLDKEIDKFNDFFLDKEEDCIIKMDLLKDKVAGAIANGSSHDQELMRDLADLHAEMVLLTNYSALNCTGLAKISKKYVKRTGAPVICFPNFIHDRVIQQPFFSTQLLHKLAKECDTMFSSLSSRNRPSGNGGIIDPEELGNLGNIYLKLTKSALTVLQQIRSGSSTVSRYSLPPLNMPDE